jgi:hypothetical protein
LEQLWEQKFDAEQESAAFLENMRDIMILGQKRMMDDMDELRRRFETAEQERSKFETHVRHHILDKEVAKVDRPWEG